MPVKDGHEPGSQSTYITWAAMSGVQKAIVLAGSQAKLAELEGVTQQAVSEWEAKGYVPSRHVFSAAFMFDIPKKDLLAPWLRALLEED